jgi:hypothetical protein
MVKAPRTLITIALLCCLRLAPASAAAREGEFSASPDGRLHRFVHGQWVDCPPGSQLEAANGALFVVDGPLTPAQAFALTEVFERLTAQNPHGPARDSEGHVIRMPGLTTTQLTQFPAFPGTHGMPNEHGLYFDGSGPQPSLTRVWLLAGAVLLVVAGFWRFNRSRARRAADHR